MLDYEKELSQFNGLTTDKIMISDVDLTIAKTENRDYEHSEPIVPMIQKLNQLYDAGWFIVYYTARGQLSRNGNQERIEKECRPLLEKWMKDNGVKYHKLLFTKVYGTYYLDDKALTPDKFLSMDISEF